MPSPGSFLRYKLSKSKWPWIDLSRSLKVKSDCAVALHMHALCMHILQHVYDILITSNIKHMSICYHLAVVNAGKYFLIVGPKCWPTYPPLWRWDFFHKSYHFFPGIKGNLPPKIKLIGRLVFSSAWPCQQSSLRYFVHRHTHSIITVSPTSSIGVAGNNICR